MEALVDDGVVVLGGPLADGERVVLIVEATSEDDVRTLLAGDPWSGTHLVLEAIDPWSIRLDGRERDHDAATAQGASEARGLVFVGTHTDAPHAMRRFVEDVLGLEPVPIHGTDADVFDLGGGAALAVVAADPGEPLERTVGLLVDDLEAVIGRLHAAGVETDGIHENERWRYTHFRPPDGRLYELVEERVRA
jgi:glyoxylase I family protein